MLRENLEHGATTRRDPQTCGSQFGVRLDIHDPSLPLIVNHSKLFRPGETRQSPTAPDSARQSPTKSNEVATMTTGEEPRPGAEGALTPRTDAPEGVVIYVGVDDIEAALTRIRGAGGTAVTGKQPIPTVGWTARFRDTEGNLVGLFQPDPTVPFPVDGPVI
jgi:predicted enzyme related to lactoylglutathione lyase